MSKGGYGRSVGVSLVGNMFSPVAAIATAPILTHSMSVADRGLVAGATAPLMFALVIGTIGLPEAATHFIAANVTAAKTVFVRSLLQVLSSGLIVFGALWMLAPIIASGNENLSDLIRLCGLALIPGLVTGLLRGVAAGLNLWSLIAIEKMVSAGCRLLLIAATAAAGVLTVEAASYIMAAASSYGILVYVVGAIRSRKKTKVASGSGIDAPTYGAILSFGSRVWMGSTAGIILSRIDQVLLPSLSDIDQLAYYAVAVSIAELASVLIFAIRDVSFRAESALADIDRTASMARVALLGSGIIVVPLVIFARFWIPFVFGDPYTASVLPTAILLLSAFVNAPGSIAGSALSGRGLPQIRSYAVMIAAVLNVALVFVLAPSYGAVGASVATLASATFASSLCVVWLARNSGVRWRDFFLIRKSDIEILMSRVKIIITAVKEKF